MFLGTSQQQAIGAGVFYPGTGVGGFVSALFSGNVTIGIFQSQTNATILPGSSGGTVTYTANGQSVDPTNYVLGASGGGGIGGFYATGVNTVTQLSKIGGSTTNVNLPNLSLGSTEDPSGGQSLFTLTVPRGPGASVSVVPTTTTPLYGK